MGPRPNRQGFSSEVCFGQPEAVLKHACLQGGNGHWLWLAARQEHRVWAGPPTQARRKEEGTPARTRRLAHFPFARTIEFPILTRALYARPRSES